MKANAFILLGIVIVLALPFALRDEQPVLANPDASLVIITPHNEAIRSEFARGFADWYEARTGEVVYLDYRVIGGTSEIAKFIRSEYLNSFRNYWTNELGRDWTIAVEQAVLNQRLELDDTPEDDSEPEAARRAYLASEVSCGIDLFFGGGTYDFRQQAAMGTLVDAGLLESHPDWFLETAEPGTLPAGIPREFAGEVYYDAAGRWFGAVLSSYGIIYNRPALRKLGIEDDPTRWEHLGDPRLFGQVAVCDPTKSGSMTQAFEMIVQQQMQERLAELVAENPTAPVADLEARAVPEGWARGMALIQRIAANARYFTDTSQKPNIDVAMGDCAAGMSIDFYGRYQQQNIVERGGGERFGFKVIEGGTTISADPIGLLRGAPNRAVAEAFIEYVLSVDGQKLWNFPPESEGGPVQYAIRRPPVRPDLYTPEFNDRRTDADFNPYVAAKDFRYRGDWTGRLFSELRTIIRICFIDVRPELVAAWRAILEARAEGRLEDADRAEAVFSNLDRISYAEAATTIDAALKAPRIEEVRLARDLSEHFRQQFLEAQRVAQGG